MAKIQIKSEKLTPFEGIFSGHGALCTDIDSAEIFKEKIVKLPQDKVPIIIAGGSFNSKGRETVITERGKELLKELIEKLDSEKAYFVIVCAVALVILPPNRRVDFKNEPQPIMLCISKLLYCYLLSDYVEPLLQGLAFLRHRSLHRCTMVGLSTSLLAP